MSDANPGTETEAENEGKIYLNDGPLTQKQRKKVMKTEINKNSFPLVRKRSIKSWPTGNERNDTFSHSLIQYIYIYIYKCYILILLEYLTILYLINLTYNFHCLLWLSAYCLLKGIGLI